MRTPAVAAAMMLLVVACSDDEDSASTQSTVSASTGATSSTAAPATTVVTTSTDLTSTDLTATTAAAATAAPPTDPVPTTAPTVPPAPPTTAAPSVELVLLSNGIGPVTFGTPEAEVLAILEAALGPVSSEITNTYPNDLGDGTFLDDAGVDVFAYRAHRTACFDNALCVVFGGDAPGALDFVGWVQNNQGIDAPLATSAGITAGTIWADHVGAIDVDEFGCYTIGYGTTDGIDVLLSSAGEPFLVVDDAGNATPMRPDPADVTVIELEAGEHPSFVGDDC